MDNAEQLTFKHNYSLIQIHLLSVCISFLIRQPSRKGKWVKINMSYASVNESVSKCFNVVSVVTVSMSMKYV